MVPPLPLHAVTQGAPVDEKTIEDHLSIQSIIRSYQAGIISVDMSTFGIAGDRRPVLSMLCGIIATPVNGRVFLHWLMTSSLVYSLSIIVSAVNNIVFLASGIQCCLLSVYHCYSCK